METISAIRDVFKALNDFETTFEKVYQVSLNEAMVLCTLHSSTQKMTATQLAHKNNLSSSHASKVLRILEEKKLIIRTLGSEDRRQMYFNLSHTGTERVNKLKLDKVKIPPLLAPLFN